MKHGWCGFLLLILSGTFPGTLQADGPSAVRLDRAGLDRGVRALLDEHGEGVEASIWVGGPVGGAWYDWKANTLRPTASAIKTAYLVELFAAHAGKLDEPLPGLAAVLKDEHPAIAHFPAGVRAEIRRELTGASVRRVGEVMIGKAKAPNPVYNAAANVTTAVLGGPQALTQKIQQRDGAFAALHARRYMLAARTVTGDNEATADALAAVLQALASRRLQYTDRKTVEAMRDVLQQAPGKASDTHFGKSGALDSDPLVRVQSGWWEGKGASVVYVVMTAQPSPGMRPREEAGKRLAATTNKLTALTVGAARSLQVR